MKHTSTGTIVLFGGAVKAKGEGKVGGHLVLFGDAASKDLSGQWFTAATDYDTEFPGKSSVYFHHALDPTLKTKRLTPTKAEIGVDDVGVWIEGVLDVRDQYAAAVYKMVEDGQLGWSSGTASHLVEADASGEIKYWPLGLDASLTPTPCDSRNLASVKSFTRPLKSISVPTFDQLRGVKSEGLSSGDKRRVLMSALDRRLSAGGFYQYAYVDEDYIFETTFVFSMGDRKYEMPYTIAGFDVTLGEPFEVQRITKFVPVAAPTPDPADGLKTATSAQLRAELQREKLKTFRPLPSLVTYP